MKRLIVSLIFLAAMAGTAAADVFVFETVDEFEHGDQQMHFSGLPQGGAEPIDLVAVWYSEPIVLTATCERLALMAMARPGRYFFRVNTQTDIDNTQYLLSCRLIRR